MSDIKLATFNLLHFAEPGVYWHDKLKPATATYTPAEWAAKKAWIADRLTTMAADVVAFQEVVAVKELRSLVAGLGYVYFHSAAEPKFHKDDASVYVNATVAIASKWPLQPTADFATDHNVPKDSVIDGEFRFSRTPAAVSVDFPQGKLKVFGLHLKSQGTFVEDETIEAAGPQWEDKFRALFRLRSLEGLQQVAKRSAEAAVVYRAAMTAIEHEKNVPVVILGDLNEGPQSNTLAILTQMARVYNVGLKPYEKLPDAEKAKQFDFKLYDSYGLVPNNGGPRPNTHKGNHPGVLDFVLVSNALNPKSKLTHSVQKVEVLDQHFVDQTDERLSSDHAPVLVTIRANA